MGGQYHHELIRYCPPSNVLCVSSHFWPFTIVKFVLEKLDKNLGLADPHPPQLGQNPKFFQKLDLKASLTHWHHNIFMTRYPSSYTPANTGSCVFTISKASADVCQLRLDFEVISLP